ncbi:MAG: SDR family NAD(P)-dependent oxidoreductase [Polyangiaceae bacterium]|nr:SDR family NAD(P)-dependent oxidoreductase [Polyangiaceae bacterium]
MKLGAGTTAVVTGAGGGLGRSIALDLARRGARVLVSDVDGAAAERVVGELRDRGAQADAMTCDVARLEEVEALARRADELFGATDLLVNNAGVAAAGAMGDLPIEDWRWVIDVDLWGPIHGCHAWVPRMKRRGRGHVLNVASIAGVASAPLMGPYNVAKAGVISLSETLAAELEKDGVGVTVLCPFFFQTNVMKSSRRTGEADRMSAVAEKLMRDSKLTADDVARLALDACEAGRLYCLAHREAKAIWAMKRLAGERFRRVVTLLERRAVRG